MFNETIALMTVTESARFFGGCSAWRPAQSRRSTQGRIIQLPNAAVGWLLQTAKLTETAVDLGKSSLPPASSQTSEPRQTYKPRVVTHSCIFSPICLARPADSSTAEESILSQHRTSFVSDDGSQSVTMKNLVPRTTYQISVAASNDIGTSHPSDTLNVTTKVDRE